SCLAEQQPAWLDGEEGAQSRQPGERGIDQCVGSGIPVQPGIEDGGRGGGDQQVEEAVGIQHGAQDTRYGRFDAVTATRGAWPCVTGVDYLLRGPGAPVLRWKLQASGVAAFTSRYCCCVDSSSA